jgi:hypothetical protein
MWSFAMQCNDKIVVHLLPHVFMIVPNLNTKSEAIGTNNIYLNHYLFLCNVTLFIIIFSGSAAQRGLWPPLSRGFVITHNDAPQSVGIFWTRPLPDNIQHTQQTNIHASVEIRTHDCSRRAAVDLRLR